MLATITAWLLVKLNREDAVLTWRAIGIAHGEGFNSDFLTALETQFERRGIVWEDWEAYTNRIQAGDQARRANREALRCSSCHAPWRFADPTWEQFLPNVWVHSHGTHARFKSYQTNGAINKFAEQSR